MGLGPYWVGGEVEGKELVQGVTVPGGGARGGLVAQFAVLPNVQVTDVCPYAKHPLGDEYVRTAANRAPLRPATGDRVTLAPGVLAASAAFEPNATTAAPARNTAATARFTGQFWGGCRPSVAV